MKNKKVQISYTCDKNWDSLRLTNLEGIKFCDSCNKNVGNYTQGNTPTTSCGNFKISQVQSFRRNFLLGASTIPLITVLGLCLSPNQMQAQAPETSTTPSENAHASEKIIIRGKIIEKDTKYPIEQGILEVRNNDSLITAALVQNGQFKLEIDTGQNAMETLDVVFYDQHQNRSLKGAVTSSDPKKFLIELDVEMNSYNQHLTITGDTSTIHNSPETTCVLKSVPSKKKKRRRRIRKTRLYKK